MTEFRQKSPMDCPFHGVHGFWSLSNKHNDGIEPFCDIRDKDGQLCSASMTELPTPPKRVAIQLRLDRKYYDWLTIQAEDRDVSKSYLVNRAVQSLSESIALPIEEWM